MKREGIILADMPDVSVTSLELAREHGPIAVAEADRITDSRRRTIKDHLRTLVDQGHLELHGAGRGASCGRSLLIGCRANMNRFELLIGIELPTRDDAAFGELKGLRLYQ